MSISSLDEDDFEDREDEEEEEELLQRELEKQARRGGNNHSHHHHHHHHHHHQHQQQQEQQHLQLQQQGYGRSPHLPPPVISAAAAGPPSRPAPAAPPPRRPPPLPQTTSKMVPARHSPSSRAPPPPPPPNQNRLNEDDESEVELLSISSSDDDNDNSSYNPDPSSRRRKESSDLRPRGGDDDYDDDGDEYEPDSWKRVDEGELARRVREMREAKLTAIPNVSKAPSINRKASMGTAGFLRNDDFIDPLRLGVIDTRNLILVPESSVENKGTDASAVKDPALREKVIYHSEKFDAKLFLSHIHQNTSHADLESGEQSLKLDLQDRKQQLKLLVKENFDCFVSCKSIVDDIHLKLQQRETDIEGGGTNSLSKSIDEVVNDANRAFKPLFERQVQAERIRSVQGMLQRFRTLFNLPSTIRSCITKGEYDLAVREYKKAKSLVLPTHVTVLKKVLDEVEKVITEFKEKLLKSLENSNVEFTQVENTVRLLLELAPGSDPLWHYLTIQSTRIEELLEGCSVEHAERVEEMKKKFLSKVELDERWKELQRGSTNGANVGYSMSFEEQGKESRDEREKLVTEQSDVLLSKLIHRLTIVLVQYVPSFWRLAMGIFNGKFGKIYHGGLVDGFGGEKKAPGSNPTLNGHSIDEVITMIVDIVTLYQTKVFNAFRAFSESNALGQHMLKAVEEVSKACSALESNDSGPFNAVQILFVLKAQITQNFVSRICSFIQNATLKLGREEEWLPISSIERNGTAFAISGLPLRFRAMLMATIDQIEEILEMFKLQTSKVNDLSAEVYAMQDSVKSTFYKCFFTVHEILNEIAVDLSEKCQAFQHESLDGSSGDHFVGLQTGVRVNSPHQQLLMVLSNVGYCKAALLPGLLKKYQHMWTSSGQSDLSENGSSLLDNLRDAFSASEDNILVKYTETKATVIGTAAGAYFLEDGIQWGAAPPVKGVRDAVVELLHPIIAVHAELYAGARPYLEKALPTLIEGLMDALLNVLNQNLLKQLRVVDLNGFSQLALELSYLETVLQAHLTASAKATLETLREQLKKKVIETMREFETLNSMRSNRPTIGEEERMQNPPISPEELNDLERKVCARFLEAELNRTRLNTICFSNGHEFQQTEYDPESHLGKVSGILNDNWSSPAAASRHRRRMSGSSISDSESGKPTYSGYPPQSPLSQSGYTSSDLGSDLHGVWIPRSVRH